MSDLAENRDVRGNTIKPHSVEAENVNANSVNTEEVSSVRFAESFSSVQAAIDDLPTSGGYLIGPFRTEDVGSTITIDKNLCWVASPEKTTLNSTITNGDPAIDVNSSHVTIKGLRIDGNSPDDGACIYLDGKNQSITHINLGDLHLLTSGNNALDVHGSVFHSTFSNLRIFNANNHGVFQTGANTESDSGNPIGNTYIGVDVSQSGSDGFNFVQGIDCTLTGCHSGNSTNDGMYFERQTNLSLYGCRVELTTNGEGFLFSDINGQVLVSNCHASDCNSRGLRVTGSGAPPEGFLVLGGFFNSNGSNGLQTTVQNCTFIHPVLVNNLTDTIDVFGSAEAVINHRQGAGIVSNRGDATRVVVNGIGQNAGDPSITGDWNGNGYEGVVVRDTSNSNTYLYNNESWSQIASA